MNMKYRIKFPVLEQTQLWYLMKEIVFGFPDDDDHYVNDATNWLRRWRWKGMQIAEDFARAEASHNSILMHGNRTHSYIREMATNYNGCEQQRISVAGSSIS